MTSFKILKENVAETATTEVWEIAQWAETFKPCDVLMFGTDIPGCGHADGVLINVHAHEDGDGIRKRVETVRDFFVSRTGLLRALTGV